MTKRLLLPCLLVPALLLIAFGAIAGDTIPTEVADRLTDAGMLHENEDFVGSFTLTVETVIQKTNGKSRKEETKEIKISRSQDGTINRSLLRQIENGKDVTEKRREKVEKELAKNGNQRDKEDEGEDEDLVNPFGETAEKYSFGEIKNEGDAALLSFEPKDEYREEEGMAQGTISWHRESLDPLWIDMTALSAPSPLQKLEMRMEFTREGDAIYMNRMVSKGVAKVLLFTRQFEADIRISEVEALTAASN